VKHDLTYNLQTTQLCCRQNKQLPTDTCKSYIFKPHHSTM